MLAFAALCFSLLFSAVLGFPLAQRDVFNPHITSPREGTVWVVGSKEKVTWETDDIPPDSQLTNPNGRVILGFLENDSLNLQLDSPLAENFKLRVGEVDITVPDVPPRDNYIIVLMGDSGNASPAFAITSIKGGSASSSRSPSGSSSSDNPSTSATPSSTINNSPPIIGSSITGALSTPLSTPASSVSVPESTAIAPSSLASSASILSSASSASVSGTETAAAAAASTSSNAAWSTHNAKLWSIIAAPLALLFLL